MAKKIKERASASTPETLVAVLHSSESEAFVLAQLTAVVQVHSIAFLPQLCVPARPTTVARRSANCTTSGKRPSKAQSLRSSVEEYCLHCRVYILESSAGASTNVPIQNSRSVVVDEAAERCRHVALGMGAM